MEGKDDHQRSLTGHSQGQEVKAKASTALPNAPSDTRKASHLKSTIKTDWKTRFHLPARSIRHSSLGQAFQGERRLTGVPDKGPHPREVGEDFHSVPSVMLPCSSTPRPRRANCSCPPAWGRQDDSSLGAPGSKVRPST